ITHQAAARANRSEVLVSTRDQLVRINLVAGIPDKPVTAEVEGQVQGEAQFDDSQIAGEGGRPQTQHADKFVAHLPGELLQLLVREPLKVLGRFDLRQQFAHGKLHYRSRLTIIFIMSTRGRAGAPSGRSASSAWSASSAARRRLSAMPS